MLDDFVDVFGFRPGSLDSLLVIGGLANGVENNLVALKIRVMKERRDEVAAKVSATDNEKKIYWLGVLEVMDTDLNRAKKLAREFEFI